MATSYRKKRLSGSTPGKKARTSSSKRFGRMQRKKRMTRKKGSYSGVHARRQRRR